MSHTVSNFKHIILILNLSFQNVISGFLILELDVKIIVKWPSLLISLIIEAILKTQKEPMESSG